MSNNIKYSFIVRDVSITMDVNSIRDDLIKRYTGVGKVTRLFHDDEDATPKTSIQVDFISLTDAEKIYQDRSIVIGGICRQTRAIKRPEYQRPKGQNYQKRQALSEEDIVNTFEEQKRILTEMLKAFDQKLNSAITLQNGNAA